MYQGTRHILKTVNGSGTSTLLYRYPSTSASFNTTSDERIKENVVNLSGSLAKINLLRPVTYTHTQEWLDHTGAGEIEYDTINTGFIAQEFKTIFPEAVIESPETVGENAYEDFHSLDVTELLVHSVSAIKELSAKNDALEARILTLESA